MCMYGLYCHIAMYNYNSCCRYYAIQNIRLLDARDNTYCAATRKNCKSIIKLNIRTMEVQ